MLYHIQKNIKVFVYLLIGLDGFTEDMINYDRTGKNSFQYRSGTDGFTDGLYALCKSFIIPNPKEHDKNIAVILIDTQGLNDLKEKAGCDRVLFALTNFLASHIIYNVVSTVKPKELLNLIFLAHHSHELEKSTLPSLNILVRDYKFEKREVEDERNEIKEYLPNIRSNRESEVSVYLLMFRVI